MKASDRLKAEGKRRYNTLWSIRLNEAKRKKDLTPYVLVSSMCEAEAMSQALTGNHTQVDIQTNTTIASVIFIAFIPSVLVWLICRITWRVRKSIFLFYFTFQKWTVLEQDNQSLHIATHPASEGINNSGVCSGRPMHHTTHFSCCEVNWCTTTKMSIIVQLHSWILQCAEFITLKKHKETLPPRKLPSEKSWPLYVLPTVPKNIAKWGRAETGVMIFLSCFSFLFHSHWSPRRPFVCFMGASAVFWWIWSHWSHISDQCSLGILLRPHTWSLSEN